MDVYSIVCVCTGGYQKFPFTCFTLHIGLACSYLWELRKLSEASVLHWQQRPASGQDHLDLGGTWRNELRFGHCFTATYCYGEWGIVWNCFILFHYVQLLNCFTAPRLSKLSKPQGALMPCMNFAHFFSKLWRNNMDHKLPFHCDPGHPWFAGLMSKDVKSRLVVRVRRTTPKWCRSNFRWVAPACSLAM